MCWAAPTIASRLTHPAPHTRPRPVSTWYRRLAHFWMLSTPEWRTRECQSSRQCNFLCARLSWSRLWKRDSAWGQIWSECRRFWVLSPSLSSQQAAPTSRICKRRSASHNSVNTACRHWCSHCFFEVSSRSGLSGWSPLRVVSSSEEWSRVLRWLWAAQPEHCTWSCTPICAPLLP